MVKKQPTKSAAHATLLEKMAAQVTITDKEPFVYIDSNRLAALQSGAWALRQINRKERAIIEKTFSQ